jgi:hypothetical protein
MMPFDLLNPLSEYEIRSLVAYLASPVQVPMLATPENVSSFFNGRDLTGWEGDPALWRVEAEAIVGQTSGLERDAFLRNDLLAEDFRLTLKVKLDRDSGHSGILFRAKELPDGTVQGYETEIGPDHWGTVLSENRRIPPQARPEAACIQVDGWNTLEIVAVGDTIRTSINGETCVLLDEPYGSRRGIFAFELPAGGPTTVRFKEIRLELNPKLDAR